jgi:hypothetical protein
MASTRKLKELVKLVQKTYRLTYEDACIKMEKEASSEQKKQIEETITKGLKDRIQKYGIQRVEEEIKMLNGFNKLFKKNKITMDKHIKADINEFNRTRKTKKSQNKTRRQVICKYIKKQGSYINHSEPATM